MRGHTVVLNASSTVIPNNAYTLKLVIADKLVWSKKFSLRLKNKKKWSTVNFDYFSMFLFVRISGNGSIKMSSQVWIYKL